MSVGPRPTALPSHIRPSSAFGHSVSSTSQSSALTSRIAEKKIELDSLRQLRDLSAGLVGQIQQLETKLGTLSDGTQVIAEVMSNWGTVLRAMALASGMLMVPSALLRCPADQHVVAKLPKPKGEGDSEQELPQTLVRIPVEHAQDAQSRAENEKVAND